MTREKLYNRGFCLIEILIAIFILTFGLLGIAGLHISSLKRTETSYWRTLTTSQWMLMHEKQMAENPNRVYFA